MEIRIVKKEEFDSLLECMNSAFNFTNDYQKFEHILPKLYYKDNPNMIHIAAFDKNKIVSAIGLYEMKLLNKNKELKIGCIGAVSTIKEYRNRGLFTQILNNIIDKAKELNYDLLFLSGNRVRYNKFGFENASRELHILVDSYSRNRLKPKEYKLVKLEKEDKVIDTLYKMYNEQEVKVYRKKDEFYNYLISWNSTPYYVLSNNKIIGYVTISNGIVNEIIYSDDFDTIVDSILSISEYAWINLNVKEYSDELLKKINCYELRHNDMFKILNLNKILDFIGKRGEKIPNLDELELVRYVLGDPFTKGLANGLIFINSANGG